MFRTADRLDRHLGDRDPIRHADLRHPDIFGSLCNLRILTLHFRYVVCKHLLCLLDRAIERQRVFNNASVRIDRIIGYGCDRAVGESSDAAAPIQDGCLTHIDFQNSPLELTDLDNVPDLVGSVQDQVDSRNQIAQAKLLADRDGMNIEYVVSSAEDIDFPDGSFDVITACQCFFYFNYDVVIPKLARLLKDGGRLVILFMAWVPADDAVAQASEDLVLKYNPDWSGAGYERAPVFVPDIAEKYFSIEARDEYDIRVPFTRESWHGRMKACRGVGASMSEQEIALWEADHIKMLSSTPSDNLEILHHAATAILRKK